METNGKNTFESSVYPEKRNQEVYEVCNKLMSQDNNFQTTLNNTDTNMFYPLDKKALVNHDQCPQFPVEKKHSSLLQPKSKNLKQTLTKSIESNVKEPFTACCSKNNTHFVNCKLIKQCLDENKPCSSQSLYRNDCKQTVDRKQDDNTNGSCFASSNPCKTNSPPSFITGIKSENDCADDRVKDAELSSLGHYGHWLEISDKNKEEIKEKFLPECDESVTGENFDCSSEEVYCESPDLDKEWHRSVPRQTYGNKHLKIYKDQSKKSCHLSICNNEAPTHSTSAISTPLSLVDVSIDWTGNEEIESSADGVSTGFVGSCLQIEEESKEIIEIVVTPDIGEPVEDIDSSNEAVLVENTESFTETPCDVNRSEENQKSTVVPETNQNFAQVLHTKENNTLDLKKGGKCVTKLMKVNVSNTEFKQIPSEGSKKNVGTVAQNKKKYWQCSSCDLLFDSKIVLKNHRQQEHLFPHECKRCMTVFTLESTLKKHLKRDNCILFKCNSCKMKFSSRELLSDHVSSHFVNCRLCEKTFKNEYILEAHTKRYHIEQTCPKCNKSLKSSMQLSVHLRRCHSEKYSKFTCSQCKSSFTTKFSLMNHLKLHSGEKNCLCSDCGESFVTSKQLRRHITSKHITDEPWKCSVCSKSFKMKWSLTTHMTVHTNNPLACTICGRRFLRIKSLHCHMQLHDGEVKFQCDICKGSFASKKTLKNHLKRHLSGHFKDKHIIKCVVCRLDKKYLKTSLKAHLKQHTLMPKVICKGKFDCHICGKRYKTNHSSGYRYHLNLHTNMNSTFKCVKCKSVFRHFVSLLCHSYLHLRTKKFLCNVCGCEFSLMKGLMEHLKVHSRNNLYKCPACKQRFPNRLVLVSHLLKQHLKQRHLHKTLVCKSLNYNSIFQTELGSSQN